MIYKTNIKLLILLIFLIPLNGLFAQRQQGNEDELLALQYYQNGEFDKAVVLYERLFKREQSMYYYGYYFESLMALEQYDKAEKLSQTQIKKNPQVFRYQVDLGLVYAAAGEQKKSDKAFSDAISTIQPSEDNFKALSQYFIFKNRSEWAIRSFETGISKLPASQSMRFELSALYLQSGRFDEMFQLFYGLLDMSAVSAQDVQQRLLAYFAADASKTLAPSFVSFALKQSQKNAQNTIYSEMLLWSYLQVADYGKALQQAIAMDKRQKADGNIVLGIIPVLNSNREYQKSIEGLVYILEKGEKSFNYNIARIEMFNARYLKATSVVPSDIVELTILESEVLSFIDDYGVQPNTLSLVRQLASVQAFYLNKPVEAKKWIETAMTMTPSKGLQAAEMKLLLADIMLLTGEQWDASLLYSQVEKDFKHDTIGFKAKFKNAQFYYYIGEFEYAQTHLSILRSATSKLISNDAMELSLLITNNVDVDSSFIPLAYFSRAEYSWKCKQPLASVSTLDSLLNIFPRHPVRDDAYFLKSRILIEMKQYQEAADNLKQILASHYTDLLADDALFMLAGLYRDFLSDNEKAMELYWQIVNDFPSSVYAQESRDIYRQLRDKTTIP